MQQRFLHILFCSIATLIITIFTVLVVDFVLPFKQKEAFSSDSESKDSYSINWPNNSNSWKKTSLNHPKKSPQDIIQQVQSELDHIHKMKAATIVDSSRSILDNIQKNIDKMRDRIVQEGGEEMREESQRMMAEEAENELASAREMREELLQEAEEAAGGTGTGIYKMSDNTIEHSYGSSGYHGNHFGMHFETPVDIFLKNAVIDANNSGTIVFRVSEWKAYGQSHGETIAEKSFDVNSGEQTIDLNMFVPGSNSKSYVIWYPKNSINSNVRLRRTGNGNDFSNSSVGPVKFKGGASSSMSQNNTRWYYLFELEFEAFE